jgi:hypothetical protein
VRSIFRHLTFWVAPRGMSWFVLAFFVAMLFSILLAPQPWPSRSAIFPVFVAGVAIFIAVLETAVANIGALRSRFAPRGVLDLSFTSDLDEGDVKQRSNAAIGWLIFLTGGAVLVGFHLIVPIFMIAYLRFMARASWLATLIYTAVTWVVVFVVFARMMEVRWLRPVIAFW